MFLDATQREKRYLNAMCPNDRVSSKLLVNEKIGSANGN
jgi:hypothetical protein